MNATKQRAIAAVAICAAFAAFIVLAATLNNRDTEEPREQEWRFCWSHNFDTNEALVTNAMRWPHSGEEMLAASEGFRRFATERLGLVLGDAPASSCGPGYADADAAHHSRRMYYILWEDLGTRVTTYTTTVAALRSR